MQLKQVNHIDIASNHAGTMVRLTNCVSNTCGFIAPSVVAAIVYTSVINDHVFNCCWNLEAIIMMLCVVLFDTI